MNSFTVYGAVTAGSTRAIPSVERRALQGEELVLLTLCEGDLAAPALECVKRAFAGLKAVDEGVAALLVRSAPPSIAHTVAVMVLYNGRVYAAASGNGKLYRQRERALEAIEAGAYEAEGAFMLASDSVAAEGGDFFLRGESETLPLPSDGAFHNDTLDALLDRCLASAGASDVAVAAMVSVG